MVRGKKISSRSGKSQGISLRVEEKLNLRKKSGKSEILRVHINLFLLDYSFFLARRPKRARHPNDHTCD